MPSGSSPPRINWTVSTSMSHTCPQGSGTCSVMPASARTARMRSRSSGSREEHLPEARRACFELMRAVRDWEPSAESEKTAYGVAEPAAQELRDARRLRILACRRGIPALEWCAVILGRIVTVGLTYFLVLDDPRIQDALTAMVAVLIALNISLILMFAYPFSGDLSVHPDSFHVALAILEEATPTGSP
jgi:hypothetical protein